MGAERESAIEEVAGALRAVLGPRRGGVRGGPRLPAALREITMAQLRGLLLLAHEQPLAIGALGDRLEMALPGASRLVDRLVTEGLVERYADPADRRRGLVRLAPRGLAALDEMQAGRREGGRRLRRTLGRLSDVELARLGEALAPLVAAARAEAPPATEGGDGGPIAETTAAD